MNSTDNDSVLSQTETVEEPPVAHEDHDGDTTQEKAAFKQMNLPNILTIARIIMVPILIVMMLRDEHWAAWTALIIFCVAAYTDQVDGKLARKNNQVTTFGKIADPIADKLLVLGSFITLSLSAVEYPYWWFTSVVILREIAVTGLRMVLLRKSIVVPASKGGKLKTALQMLLIFMILLIQVLYPYVGLGTFFYVYQKLMEIVLIPAFVVTVLTGLQYFLDAYDNAQDKKEQSVNNDEQDSEHFDRFDDVAALTEEEIAGAEAEAAAAERELQAAIEELKCLEQSEEEKEQTAQSQELEAEEDIAPEESGDAKDGFGTKGDALGTTDDDGQSMAEGAHLFEGSEAAEGDSTGENEGVDTSANNESSIAHSEVQQQEHDTNETGDYKAGDVKETIMEASENTEESHTEETDTDKTVKNNSDELVAQDARDNVTDVCEEAQIDNYTGSSTDSITNTSSQDDLQDPDTDATAYQEDEPQIMQDDSTDEEVTPRIDPINKDEVKAKLAAVLQRKTAARRKKKIANSASNQTTHAEKETPQTANISEEKKEELSEDTSRVPVNRKSRRQRRRKEMPHSRRLEHRIGQRPREINSESTHSQEK